MTSTQNSLSTNYWFNFLNKNRYISSENINKYKYINIHTIHVRQRTFLVLKTKKFV